VWNCYRVEFRHRNHVATMREPRDCAIHSRFGDLVVSPLVLVVMAVYQLELVVAGGVDERDVAAAINPKREIAVGCQQVWHRFHRFDSQR